MSDKESHVTKSDLTILGGVNCTDDLPSNRQVRFTPNRQGRFTPQIAKYDLPPLKSSNFEQNFKRTQHHALLHKGLFCERPITRPRNFCQYNEAEVRSNFMIMIVVFLSVLSDESESKVQLYYDDIHSFVI